MSVTAGLDGRASRAFSKGIGGIEAQTALPAPVDTLSRRADAEPAAAGSADPCQCGPPSLPPPTPLLAGHAPETSVPGVLPGSGALVPGHAGGGAAKAQSAPRRSGIQPGLASPAATRGTPKTRPTARLAGWSCTLPAPLRR
jgi:cation:H+ antiporter